MNAIVTPSPEVTAEDRQAARRREAEAAQQAIAELIAPVSWSKFVSEHLGKAPLHVSGDATALGKLADPGGVRKLIEAGTPWQFRRMPEMYLDGLRVPHEDLVDAYADMDGREARQPRLKRIRRLLERGATVNAFGQEGNFPGLAWLREIFSRAFSSECAVATFYSQKDHQGLLPHYDCVEIFVLQLYGRKRWFVSSQRVESPVVGYGTATMYDDKASHAEMVSGAGRSAVLPARHVSPSHRNVGRVSARHRCREAPVLPRYARRARRDRPRRRQHPLRPSRRRAGGLGGCEVAVAQSDRRRAGSPGVR